VGTAPPITAISQGLDAKIVAAVNINGSNLVLRPGIEYSGPESLAGLNIATFPPGTIQDLVLKKWLKDHGVDVSKVNLKGMGPGDALTAIEAGKVEGAFLPQPYPAIIELDEKGKNVVASGEMWPNHACCSLVVSGKLIRENPELVKQIIRIHKNATEYINEHPDEAAEIYAKKIGQDINQVKKSLQTWDGKWITDPHQEIPSTLEYAAEDYELKYIEKNLTEKDLFDTSFYDSLA
jgi:NitT/TauT family transport system substrate-binding protein